MANFGDGRVRVRNGQTRVLAAWGALVVSVSGTFDDSTPETVEWMNSGNPGDPADGSGEILFWDDVGKELRFVRQSGIKPVVGAVFVGQTSGAQATIGSFDGFSPPRFDLNVSAGAYFTASKSDVAIQVSGTNLDEDGLDLVSAWSEDDADDVAYTIFQDATPNFGLRLWRSGDIDPSTALSLALTEIDRILARRTPKVLEKAASYQAVAADDHHLILADASGAAVTVTLPPAATGDGYMLRVKSKDSTSGVAVEPQAGEDIDGVTDDSIALATDDRLTVISDGLGWWRVD